LTTTADLLSGGVNELLCVVAMGPGRSGTLPLQPPGVYSYLVTGSTISVLYSSDHRHCTVWYFCQGIYSPEEELSVKKELMSYMT